MHVKSLKSTYARVQGQIGLELIQTTSYSRFTSSLQTVVQLLSRETCLQSSIRLVIIVCDLALFIYCDVYLRKTILVCGI